MSYELHGDTGTRLHRIWKSMKCRCNDSNHPSFKNYGARGIGICEEWRESYTAFKKWALSNGYADDLELERIDVNRGYYPVLFVFRKIFNNIINVNNGIYGETKLLTNLCHCTLFTLAFFLAVNHYKASNNLGFKG